LPFFSQDYFGRTENGHLFLSIFEKSNKVLKIRKKANLYNKLKKVLKETPPKKLNLDYQ